VRLKKREKRAPFQEMRNFIETQRERRGGRNSYNREKEDPAFHKSERGEAPTPHRELRRLVVKRRKGERKKKEEKTK